MTKTVNHPLNQPTPLFFFDTESQTSRETLTVETLKNENSNGLTGCEPRSQEASFPQNLLD